MTIQEQVSNYQNTLTVLTNGVEISLQDVGMGKNVYNRCEQDRRQLYPSFSACRRTAILPGQGKEGNVLFNNALNTFYLRLYGVRYMKDHSAREETHCRHMGYSFRLAARVLFYAPSHRQDETYHGHCYTSCGSLAGTRNSSMGPPHEGSIRRPIAP